MTIESHADRIVNALPAEVRHRLATAPLDAIDEAGFRVGQLDEPVGSIAGGSRWCDGLSTTDEGVVLYVASPNSRRKNFTLLHEYAHVLVEADDTAMIWLADQPNDRAVTEQLCNAIAARLLVPVDVVNSVVGPGPVLAEHLLTLHRETEASQVVIAIAIARRLTSEGAVLLVDRGTNRVAHAAIVGDLGVWPWKDQDVPDTHPLRRLQPRQHLQARSWWATPWGDRQTYYLDAVATDKRAYTILSTTDLWNIERFHGGDVPPEPTRRPTRHRKCRCGYAGPMTGYPCPDCGVQFCPRCRTCLCDQRNSELVRCKECAVSYTPSALVDGRCSNCR